MISISEVLFGPTKKKFTSLPPEVIAEFDNYRIEEQIDFMGESDFIIKERKFGEEWESPLLSSYSTIEDARESAINLVKQKTKRIVNHKSY